MATVHDAARDGDLLALAHCLRIDAGCVRHRDEFLRTPLHWACLRGHRVVVEWLLDHGSDPNTRDRGGYTPFSLATHGERLDDRRAADRRAIAASSWPYPQVWRWPWGRVLRGIVFLVFLLSSAVGLALVRPGCAGRNWNTVEVVAEPRLISGDYSHKPLKAMAGSGDTLAVLTEEGDVYLLDTQTRLSRTLCHGVLDLASDENGTVWLLRADGGIDRASPLAIGGFSLTEWLAPAERFWKTSDFNSAEVLACDLDEDGWLLAVPGGVARYRMNAEGSQRKRTWQTSEMSSRGIRNAVVVPSGVWTTGTNGGVRFVDRKSLESLEKRQLVSPEISTFNAGVSEMWASAVDEDGKLWLHPSTDSGWVGPLFAGKGTHGPPAAVQLSSAIVQKGFLSVGSKAEGLFHYDPSRRCFHRLDTNPVERLLPAGAGVLALGRGLRHFPLTATSENSVHVLDEADVPSADVSENGGLCVYQRSGLGDLPTLMAVAPVNAGQPYVLASNLGWGRAGRPIVRAVIPWRDEHLVVTDIGAFRYNSARRTYVDQSKSEGQDLRFRSAHRSGSDIVAVTVLDRVYRTSTTDSAGEPWTPVDFGGLKIEQSVACGASVAVVGREELSRRLAVKTSEAKVVSGAILRHRHETTFSNQHSVADLHTPGDGTCRVTLAGPPQDGYLPVFQYDSAASETTYDRLSWSDPRPPKQIRWHPSLGYRLLREDGSIVDGLGKRVFGQGASPLKPNETSAIASTTPTGVIVGGSRGRIAEYDWKSGSWLDRSLSDGKASVQEVGYLAGTVFARTNEGVWSQVSGELHWRHHPDVTQWLTWMEAQQPRGWLIGPNGARGTTARPDPAAKPAFASASGVRAFLKRSWFVWRSDANTGDWVAFTDGPRVGRYSVVSDTWSEETLTGFRKLTAAVPLGSGDAVLMTDSGLLQLSSTLRTASLSTDFGLSGDTVANTKDEFVATTAETRRGMLLAQGWRPEKAGGRELVTSFRVGRVASPNTQTDLAVVAAVPSREGLLLLSADGGVTEYNPDTGLFPVLYTPPEGEQLLGWYDSLPLRTITKLGEKYRLRSFTPDSKVSVEFETDRPPERWPEGLRAELPALAKPSHGWFQRRTRQFDPDSHQTASDALVQGLLNSVGNWQGKALQAPPVLRKGGGFSWVRGTGVEVRRSDDGKVEFRLVDGKNTLPLHQLPTGGFVEDCFSRLGVDPTGAIWGLQEEPRQLVRLAPRGRGLARVLSIAPIAWPDHLEPRTAADGGLEFVDRFRPGVFWSIEKNALVSHPSPRLAPLPRIPVGDASLVFQRASLNGESVSLNAHLEVGGVHHDAWVDIPNGTDRPAWSVTTDAALAGNVLLTATPIGLVVRNRETFALTRILPRAGPISFVRDGSAAAVRIDIGPDSFEWIDGPRPLKPIAREAITQILKVGPWHWHVRHLSPDAHRIESITDAKDRARVITEYPSLFDESRWGFADDRVNWIGKPADGADLFLATDDGVWPMMFDALNFLGRGEVRLPGERVERLRCPAGPIWGRSDGVNWSAVQSGSLLAQPGTPVPQSEAIIPQHGAWSGSLTDGTLTLLPADAGNRPGFERGQPYFDRLDGIASFGGRLFTLSFERAVVERDPALPGRIVGVRPLPADLPAGWLHQLEHREDRVDLAAKNPTANEWKRWVLDPVGAGWTAIPATDLREARVQADTGVFRWQTEEPGGALLPVLNTANQGEGPWKSESLPFRWWWQGDRFSWDVVRSAVTLDDATALVVTDAGPMTVVTGDGRGIVSRVWSGVGFLTADAARLPDGRKAGGFVRDGTGEKVFFDSGTRTRAAIPSRADVREPVASVGLHAGKIDFKGRWENQPSLKLQSELLDVGLGTEDILRGGQFVFDSAATACPLPGAPDRWATVTPEGLVCVFDFPPGGGVPTLRSITPSAIQNVTAIRAASPQGVSLLVAPDAGAGVRGERPPQWVAIVPGANPPEGKGERELFRNGARVSVDPTRLLWTRNERYLFDGQPAVSRHETGRDPFASTPDGMALAVDVADSIAVQRRPSGTEVSLLTRGGLLQTTTPEAETAFSFPQVKSVGVTGGRPNGRVRYGPTGEAWARSGDGVVGRISAGEWRPTFGLWIDDPWPVGGRRVSFPSSGGVTVNGLHIDQSNNSWRIFWQRPFGPVIDAYPRGDVMWAATRENGVFKVHPTKLVPDRP